VSRLREAARRALEGVGEATGEGEVTRLTVDVSVDGRSELVTLALKDGELVWTSSGEAEGPHVRAALRWLAASEPPPRKVRVNESAELQRVSWTPGEVDVETAESPPSARARLADALEDVVTVVVRAGAGEPDSPSVAESLERLRREAPLPTPTGLARWLGRLKDALAAKDLVLVARLLEGAGQLARDLRRERPTAAARRRVVGWMGGTETGAIERLSDRTLVEVSREWLPSSERGGVERRYLVDLQNGEVFREERSRSAPVASVGPCPRIVSVGLAEVEDSAAPRRIRLMQYVVSLELGAGELRRIGASAYRRFSALADRYRTWMAEHPGQAEPFAVVAPRDWSAAEPVGYDDEGEPLPFARADDPAAVEMLARLVPPEGPQWIAGRLVDAGGALLMVPCAVAIVDGDTAHLHRLR
jgi:hypothetical protein